MSNTTLNEQFVAAARNGDLDALQRLQGQGADPCFEDSQALMEAARGATKQHEECMSYLLLHSDATAQDFQALRTAIARCSRTRISLLLPSFTGFKDAKRLSHSFRDIIRIGHIEAFDALFPQCSPAVYQDAIRDALIYQQRDFVTHLLRRMDSSDLDVHAFLESNFETQETLKSMNLKEGLEISHMVQSFFESLILQKQLPSPLEEKNKPSKKQKSI